MNHVAVKVILTSPLLSKKALTFALGVKRDIKKWHTQQNNTKIHSICLTGDIAQSGQENQYDSINEKINAILTTTGCARENLFIIPGNHDV